MLAYDINKQLSFGVMVNVQPESLGISTYTFKNGAGKFGEFELAENSPAPEHIDIRHSQTITLQDLKNLPEWEDYTLWNVVVKDFAGVELSRPINRNSFTMSSKINRAGFINILSSIVLELVVPHHNVISFEDIGIAVTTGQGFPLISNVLPLERVGQGDEPADMGLLLRQRLLPAMTIAGPDFVESGGAAECVVAVTANGDALPQPVTVYVESDSGYLPVRRRDGIVHTTSFIVKAADLEPGHVIRLKAGFKYWSALARKEITVI